VSMKCNATIVATILFFTLSASGVQGQSSRIDSVRNELHGAWRMNADTNMYLVFTSDSVIHHMFRTSGTGRSKYLVTDTSCDPKLPAVSKTIFILETYRYYQYKEPREGKLCSEIVSLKNGALVLKRDKVEENYTKLKSIPQPHK
jgi:hypothetical protein